jgi:hypothetical protein
MEVLGVALRLRKDESVDANVADDDQDLLFATIRSPFTMLFAPFTTDAHDYFNNQYWAVSPFDVPGIGKVKFRISPSALHAPSKLNRDARLLTIAASGRATLRVEARQPYCPHWSSIATITLHDRANIDQEALRFSPFHSGRGIVPRGFVHALRKHAYPASQRGRALAAT